MSLRNWFKISLNETEIFLLSFLLDSFQLLTEKPTQHILDYILIKFRMIKSFLFTHRCEKHARYLLLVSESRTMGNNGRFCFSSNLIKLMFMLLISTLHSFQTRKMEQIPSRTCECFCINHFYCDWSFYISL